MHDLWKPIVWRQFGAAIDALENAIRACPEGIWGDRSARPEYWYSVFHVLFFLDLYLHRDTESFAPPPPFTLDEMDPRGIMPERVYSKDELLMYLAHGRGKCRATIEALTETEARRVRSYPWGQMTNAELLLHNLRHVQHHTAQLNLILRQRIDSAPRWVFRAKDGIESKP